MKTKTKIVPERTKHILATVREMVQACIQCGTCTGSCPNAFAMTHTPRTLWRMVMEGRNADVLSSKTFILCSSCYTCTLRCPRGLPLTNAMSLLTQAARDENQPWFVKSQAFYTSFLDSVRRRKRVNETEFMSLFFWKMKDPALSLEFASLGLKLMKKRKISLPVFFQGQETGLKNIFEKTRQMEAEQMEKKA